MLTDLRLAFRRLVRTPLFSLTAMGVLALGISTNALVVTYLRGFLDQGSTFRDPSRVVLIQPGGVGELPPWGPLSAPQLQDLKAQATTLDAWVGVRDAMGQLQTSEGAGPMPLGLVTPGGLKALGVPFALGTEGEDPDGVVLTHGAWLRRFGGDVAVVGRSLWLDGRARRVHGVLAKGVRLPFFLAGAEAFRPLIFAPGEQASRDIPCCWVFARMAPGRTLKAVRHELAQLGGAVASGAQASEGWRLGAQTMTGFMAVQARQSLGPLGLLAGFLLLLISANVAGMHLARLAERAHESALRSALGADRSGLLRALGLEALLLSLGGGLMGLGFLGVLLRMLPTQGIEPRIDTTLVLLMGIMALLAALTTGLLPAWLGSRNDLRTLLSQAAPGALGSGRMRWRKALVVAQVALTAVLLTGAGMAGQAVRRLKATDMGLRPDGVAAIRLTLPEGLDAQGRNRFGADLERYVAHQPGVRSVGMAAGMPCLPTGDTARFWPLEALETTASASVQQVSAGYFGALEIPLRAGRTFEGTGEGECLVTESMAKRLWPGKDALGRQIRLSERSGSTCTVVGVVAEHRHNGLGQRPEDQLFTSYRAGGFPGGVLLVRVNGDPLGVGAALVQNLRAFNPQLQLDELQHLRDVADFALAEPLHLQEVLVAGGLLAAFLSGLGLHATTRSLTVQRTREFGLRLALGATRGGVMRAALLDPLRQTAYGFLLGQVGALALALCLGATLQGVKVADLRTLLGVGGLLGFTTLLATLLPALRALRVNPADALRAE